MWDQLSASSYEFRSIPLAIRSSQAPFGHDIQRNSTDNYPQKPSDSCPFDPPSGDAYPQIWNICNKLENQKFSRKVRATMCLHDCLGDISNAIYEHCNGKYSNNAIAGVSEIRGDPKSQAGSC